MIRLAASISLAAFAASAGVIAPQTPAAQGGQKGIIFQKKGGSKGIIIRRGQKGQAKSKGATKAVIIQKGPKKHGGGQPSAQIGSQGGAQTAQ